MLSSWISKRRFFLIFLILSAISFHQVLELKSIYLWRMQTGNSVLSERWLAKNVKEGQSVLLIHDGNSKAIFPSIKSTKGKTICTY